MATKTAPKRRYECCRPWDELQEDNRGAWPYQVLHELSHSRVPFSIQRYASLAKLDDGVATSMIIDGVKLKWIRYADVAGLYIGRLARKR